MVRNFGKFLTIQNRHFLPHPKLIIVVKLYHKNKLFSINNYAIVNYMNTPLIEKRLHVTFEISLLLKGIQAVLEIISGFIVFFTPTSTILKLITLFTTEELIEDPRDLIAQYLIKTVGDLSISGQHFISF